MREEFVDDREWLAQQFDALTTEVEIVTPSAWAESKRYLPPSVTSMPGPYRYDIAPYLREIVDCLSLDSPVREVAIMKGVQLGLTVGVLENAIGYYIEHVKTAPLMLVTADAELAKLRMESYITPMLQLSGLDHLIKSSDEQNARKTGKTDKKIEWVGGGFLVPFGAQNANKLRSISIQVMLRDEVDGWPRVVGKDGDPMKLSADRTAAYEGSRKILDISTPLVRGQSAIEKRFQLGDQRYYFVCCLRCGFPQTLRWRREHPKTGEQTGMMWETEGGRLVPDSVRYRCENCSHDHSNDDKTRLLSPTHGAEWRPTAEPAMPDIRSYHISALYSPVGMQTWTTCVQKWLEAWDEQNNRVRDARQLQVFYNNVLGETYTVRGDKLRFEKVSEHRRAEYAFGEIPNALATRVSGAHVLLLTCTVDVQKENLAVSVYGWCRDRRGFLIDYWRFEGDTEQLDDAGTWVRLRELLEQKVYVADDGKKYRVQLTLIDSRYRTDTVYTFCAEYSAGVYPIMGRDAPVKGSATKEFASFKTPLGRDGWIITVDFYKDRWSRRLRNGWDGMSLQPEGHFNAPRDATDAQLKELTVETKIEVKDKDSGETIGFTWHRPSGAANELWDLLVYQAAALDMMASEVSLKELELDQINWPTFFHLAEHEKRYFEP
jgi:phage terminase large subunit GpA-like protein